MLLIAFIFGCSSPDGGGGEDTEPTPAPILPEIEYIFPADESIDNYTNTILIITFSEIVYVDTGNIIIYVASDDSVFETIPADSIQVTGSGSTTIEIDPVSEMAVSAEYYIQIDSDSFVDSDVTYFPGISDTTTWNFTTGTGSDGTSPGILTLVPADDTPDVLLDAILEITFDEVVIAGPGNITIYNADDSVFESISADSHQVTGSGTDIITIDAAANFISESDYYVQIDTGAFKDMANNDFAGITDTTIWNFTALDNDPPGILTVSPADEAGNVILSEDLEIIFNEDVLVTTGNITIHRGIDDSVFEVIAVDSAQVTGSTTDTITIDPSSDMESETSYYIQIDAGAITDLVTNPFSGISDTSTWNFTIKDYLAPTVTLLSPLDNATDVPQASDLQITIDEPVTTDTGNITIRRTVGGTVFDTIAVGSVTGSGTDTITIDPSVNFESSTGYYVQIDATAFRDAANNYYAGISRSASLVINFDEPVNIDSGNITIYKTIDDSVFESIPVGSGQVTGGDQQ